MADSKLFVYQHQLAAMTVTVRLETAESVYHQHADTVASMRCKEQDPSPSLICNFCLTKRIKLWPGALPGKYLEGEGPIFFTYIMYLNQEKQLHINQFNLI